MLVVHAFHNVVCIDKVLVVVGNVYEVDGLVIDHSMDFDIILCSLFSEICILSLGAVFVCD